MMKNLFLVAVFTTISMASTLTAQKYGHLNFGNLVALMPETKSADETLAQYQKQLIAEGEKMVEKFQEDYGEFVKKAQSGTMTPKDQQEKQLALQKRQQEIIAYEQEVMEKVDKRRQELLEPIINKAQQAIDEYAKANGYAMIFDTSVFNAVLYARESDDLLPAIKAKLGL